MTKSAIQAANQAKKEQIMHVGKSHKIVMKYDRKANKAELRSSEKGDCMDVDLAFYTHTMHSWGIHDNGINTTQTEEEPAKTVEKEKRRSLTPFSL